MAHEFVYTMHDLRKVVSGDRIILEDITLSFLPGAKIGVLGANGAGKSTLLRIMAGVDTDFVGEARPRRACASASCRRSRSSTRRSTCSATWRRASTEARALLHRFEEISAKFAEPIDDDAMNAARGAGEAPGPDRPLGRVGARPHARARDGRAALPAAGDAKVETLSGGERRRVALCRLLLQKPDLLLLDEPTNHLDAESVAWLERFLAEYPGTVVAVTHDRYFLDNVAQWILELDRGRGIPWKGNYSSWLEQKEKRLEIEEKQASARSRTLQRELEWIRMSPRARQAKGKARIAYEALQAEAEQRQADTVEISIPPGPRLGDVVVVAEELRKGYGDKLLIDDLSFSLPPGGIVGVIGGNGAGKTTLFRMIVGQEKPDAGTLRLGETVKLAYVDQSRDALDPEKTV